MSTEHQKLGEKRRIIQPQLKRSLIAKNSRNRGRLVSYNNIRKYSYIFLLLCRLDSCSSSKATYTTIPVLVIKIYANVAKLCVKVGKGCIFSFHYDVDDEFRLIGKEDMANISRKKVFVRKK